MLFSRGAVLLKIARSESGLAHYSDGLRYQSIYRRSGAILPEPQKPRYSILSVICTVITGLFIGASVSKTVANFLEEKELFVPSDDDDDD